MTERTFTGMYSDLIPQVTALIKPAQARTFRNEAASMGHAPTMRTTPVTIVVATFDSLSFVRITFGYEGKPPLGTIRIGPRGGLL